MLISKAFITGTIDSQMKMEGIILKSLSPSIGKNRDLIFLFFQRLPGFARYDIENGKCARRKLGTGPNFRNVKC